MPQSAIRSQTVCTVYVMMFVDKIGVNHTNLSWSFPPADPQANNSDFRRDLLFQSQVFSQKLFWWSPENLDQNPPERWGCPLSSSWAPQEPLRQPGQSSVSPGASAEAVGEAPPQKPPESSSWGALQLLFRAETTAFLSFKCHLTAHAR